MKPFNCAIAMVICELQTEGQASLMNWVKAIQKCNEEGHAQKVGVVSFIDGCGWI